MVNHPALKSDNLKLRVAVATKGSKGLKDRVSDIFSRTPTFTIVKTEDGVIKDVEVIDNPAASFEYGTGPVVTHSLAEKKIDVVVAKEFGPGALALLKTKNIRTVEVKAGTNVRQAVARAITVK